MLKYLTMGCGVALLILSIGCYELYQHGESLAKDLATQTVNVETLKNAKTVDGVISMANSTGSASSMFVRVFPGTNEVGGKIVGGYVASNGAFHGLILDTAQTIYYSIATSIGYPISSDISICGYTI